MSQQQQNPSPNVFTAEANRYLASLAHQHQQYLTSGDDAAILLATQSAATIRRAAVVYVAAHEILPAVVQRETSRLTREIAYLRGLISRLWNALRSRDVPALATLSDAAQAVLDGFEAGQGLFELMAVEPLSVEGVSVGYAVDHRSRVEVVSDEGGDSSSRLEPRQPASIWPPPESIDPHPGSLPDGHAEDEQGVPISSSMPSRGRSLRTKTSAIPGMHTASRNRLRCSCCGLNFSDLSPRDKLVLWLYLLMVLLALGAVTAVTVDFARQQANPGAFIRSEVSGSLPAPVVTVCLSQRGVPFSRLQLFNYTDAEGREFVGADPFGPQKERQSKQFEDVVDRFWDNPDDEDCDAKVGDFFPFPLRSLNRLTSGEASTRCRQCYRVGQKQLAVARSTDFQNSSVLSFYTDNYFLQCMKSSEGLNDESKDFLRQELLDKRDDMFDFQVLQFADGYTGTVNDLSLDDLTTLDSKELCNIFYFSFFPKALERDTDDVDIRYEYDGTNWTPVGDGPYFELRRSQDFLPEESLQMFVGTNGSTKPNDIGTNRDVILIGPNTQTFATFRPVVVYGIDRYDISSSTSNLMQSAVTPIFGYWLVYRIFYNYNRFVTDEWYRESTYPASQWIVDLTGYASLFTGASLFSLLLLPLLRAMRKREKQRLIKQQPEVYLWSQHKQRYQEASRQATKAPDLSEGGNLMRGSTVMLPGYNV